MFWIILIIILIICVVVANIHNAKEKEKEKKRIEEWLKKEEEKREFQKMRKEKRKQKYEEEKNEILAKYGQPDKVIKIMDYDIKQEIIVFSKINRIWLLGEDLPFKDVLSCTFNDNYSIKKGEVEYKSNTNTSNKNMLGRAIVGGVLAGGVGAVIGGTTASKNTQTIATQKDDIIIHNYTVIININSLSNPIKRIPLGQNERKLNEIVGLINVIIAKNKE